MRKYLFTLLLCTATTLQAQDIIYSRQDSIFVVHLLQKYITCEKEKGELVLAIATEFMGHKYVAGTLEKGTGEPLVINTQEVDCTTFVEQVLAIYATISGGEKEFHAMCRNLQRIRYRGGRREGYATRLHYTSQWIADSAKHNIIEEIEYGKMGKRKAVELFFMSNNPASYKLLKEDSLLVKDIEKWEKAFCGKECCFIPKKELYKTHSELPIKNGDIIALTTNIKGLDVSHMGIAFWQEGRLHMLHASSAEGKVIKEERTLYEYQKNKKSHTGVRVFRVK